MSDLEIFGIVTAGVVGYMFVSAITQELLGWDLGADGPAGLAWPLVLPWLLGSMVAKALTAPRPPPELPEAKVVKS